MPVVWKVTGAGINPNGAGVYYTEKRSDAKKHLVAWRKTGKRKRTEGEGPDECKLSSREELCEELNAAAGAIVDEEETEVEDEETEEEEDDE